MSKNPEIHRLTESKEHLSESAHLIYLDAPGYSGEDQVIKSLEEHGYILSPYSENDGNLWVYNAIGLSSIGGFLNSTRVDSRGAEKRTRIVQKIAGLIDEISADKIVISGDETTYKNLALDESTRPVFLPTGVSFYETDSVFEAESRNKVVKLQIASSILSVMGPEDRTPFEGLIR